MRTARDTLYTGISPDVGRRLQCHNDGKGARSIRGMLPVTLEYQCELGDRGMAQRVEYRVKQLSHHAKCELLARQPNRASLIAQLGLTDEANVPEGPANG